VVFSPLPYVSRTSGVSPLCRVRECCFPFPHPRCVFFFLPPTFRHVPLFFGGDATDSGLISPVPRNPEFILLFFFSCGESPGILSPGMKGCFLFLFFLIPSCSKVGPFLTQKTHAGSIRATELDSFFLVSTMAVRLSPFRLAVEMLKAQVLDTFSPPL